MAFVALLIFGLVVMPFFAMGMRRLWLIAAVFWLPVVAYAAYLWALPFNPAEDEQMVGVWRMIVLSVAIAAPMAFAGGMLNTGFLRRRDTELEEISE